MLLIFVPLAIHIIVSLILKKKTTLFKYLFSMKFPQPTT